MPYRPSFFDPIVRLRPTPDPAPGDPPGMPPRPRGSRRPHTDEKVARVRHLIEQTTLTYGEIAARTGVGRASICRWTVDGGWKRPPWAPRATDTIPRARAGHKLRRRTLAARLTALAERYIGELEAMNCVDPDKLAEALELLKMAKLAALGRRRRRSPPSVPLPAGTRPMGELLLAGVDLQRVPRAALNDYLEHRAPPPQDDAPPRRGRRRKRDRFSSEEYHRWMLEKG
jgi:hypothetical protein